jgi:replicative DNA helicase
VAHDTQDIDTTWDLAAEKAVLGAILVRAEAFDEVADWLETRHFYRHGHRAIYAALQSLHAGGQALDAITLRDALINAGQLDAAGGFAYVTALTDGVPKSTNVEHYAGIVRSKALLRSVRDECQRIVQAAALDGASGAALLEEAEAAIYRLGSTNIRTDWVSAEQLADELGPVIERLTEKHEAISGVPSGLSKLDFVTRGWQPGDLVILGARPGSGKTAACVQWAMHAAQTVPVAMFSLEMGAQSLAIRALTSEARIDGFRLLTGQVKDDASLGRIGNGLAALGRRHLWIDESPRLSPLAMRSRLRRLATRVGRLGLVVIDYLQLMDALPEHRRESRANQVAGISRALKVMAREFGAPILALAQLNRQLEHQADKRPRLADLKDSGAIEQDADVVLFLYRPELYAKDEQERDTLRGYAELDIAKHRNGPAGYTLKLTFHHAQMRFEQQANQYDF